MEENCLYELLFSGSSLFDDEVGLDLDLTHGEDKSVQGARTAPSAAAKNVLLKNTVSDEDITTILKKKRKNNPKVKSKKKKKCVE